MFLSLSLFLVVLHDYFFIIYSIHATHKKINNRKGANYVITLVYSEIISLDFIH